MAKMCKGDKLKISEECYIVKSTDERYPVNGKYMGEDIRYYPELAEDLTIEEIFTNGVEFKERPDVRYEWGKLDIYWVGE